MEHILTKCLEHKLPTSSKELWKTKENKPAGRFFSITPFRSLESFTTFLLTVVSTPYMSDYMNCCSLIWVIKIFLAPQQPLLLNPSNISHESQTQDLSFNKTLLFWHDDFHTKSRCSVSTGQGVLQLYTFFPDFFFYVVHQLFFSVGNIQIKQNVQQVLTSESFGFCSPSISRTGCRSGTSWGNSGRKRLYPLTCNRKFQNLVSHLPSSNTEGKRKDPLRSFLHILVQ